MKTDLFQSYGHCCFFQICWQIGCSTFNSIIFQDLKYISWNFITSISLLVGILPKAHLTSHSRISGSRWVITPLWLSGSLRSFLCCSSVYSYHRFLISSASIRYISLLSFIVPIFVWYIPLVSPIFLKRSLVFHILLFSSVSLHCSHKKAFLSLLAIFQNSAFSWVSFPFSFAFSFCSFSAICKTSSDNHFAFFAFLFLGNDFDHHLLYKVMNLRP